MQLCKSRGQELCDSKSRWASWAPVRNKPTVSVDVMQHSTNFRVEKLLIEEIQLMEADLKRNSVPLDPRRKGKSVTSNTEWKTGGCDGEVKSEMATKGWKVR